MERCSHLISAKLTDSAFKHYAVALKHREGSRMISRAIVYYHGDGGPRAESKHVRGLQKTQFELHENIQGLQKVIQDYAKRCGHLEVENTKLLMQLTTLRS